MQKIELRIRSSYEPNRLAEIYLSDAYKKLIPIIKYRISKNEKNENKIKVMNESKRGIL
jgi:hypothetical protein